LPDLVWRKAVSTLGGTPLTTDLATRYSEPHRRYHDLDHARAVARDSVLLVPLSDQEKAVLILAACAHDVVYDAVPGADEQRSADWARDWLGRSGLAHVADPGDSAACALLDADLAILGSSPADYDAYAAAVRQEYSAVADEAWRSGRSRVLSSLLERDNVFLTPAGRDRWEAQARRNLARELASLNKNG
jgi:predicted metal-dependent HD superfamily phosphohydrolase